MIVSVDPDSTGTVSSTSDATPDGDRWSQDTRATETATDDGALDAFFADEPVTQQARPEPVATSTAGALDRKGSTDVEPSTRGYEARKVRRLVRHVEPWSVLKISLIFYVCLWIILLVAGTILWRVADSSGMLDNIEKFIREIFALKTFSFNAKENFRIYAVGGLIAVVAATGFTVLMAVLFNLISDLTGGVRVTVIEEERARPRRG